MFVYVILCFPTLDINELKKLDNNKPNNPIIMGNTSKQNSQ